MDAETAIDATTYQASLQGNPGAQARLHHGCLRLAQFHGRRHGLPHQDLEDLGSELFLHLLRGGWGEPSLSGPSAFDAWLHWQVKGLIANGGRVRRFERSRLARLAVLGSPESPAAESAALERLEREDFARKIRQGLTLLSSRDRFVLLCRVDDPTDYSHIARKLSVSCVNARQIVHRARARLCSALKESTA